jgi:hypothetical protein
MSNPEPQPRRWSTSRKAGQTAIACFFVIAGAWYFHALWRENEFREILVCLQEPEIRPAFLALKERPGVLHSFKVAPFIGRELVIHAPAPVGPNDTALIETRCEVSVTFKP